MAEQFLVSIPNAVGVLETVRALLVSVEGRPASQQKVTVEAWIPKSQIHPKSQVKLVNDFGTLVIPQWIAKAKGLLQFTLLPQPEPQQPVNLVLDPKVVTEWAENQETYQKIRVEQELQRRVIELENRLRLQRDQLLGRRENPLTRLVSPPLNLKAQKGDFVFLDDVVSPKNKKTSHPAPQRTRAISLDEED